MPALALRALGNKDIEIICDTEVPGFTRKEHRAGVVYTANYAIVIPLQARRRWSWEVNGSTQWCPYRDRAPQGARSQVQCMVMVVHGKDTRALAMLTGKGGRGFLLWDRLARLAAELRQQVGKTVALSSVALKVWGSEAESPFKAESLIPAWDWSVRGWATQDDVARARQQRPMLDAWRDEWGRK